MIQVTSYDPIQNIVTIDIQGTITQATPPPKLFTQSDWVTWLASVIQPVVDSLIQQNTFDPKTLVQMGDLSTVSGILTDSEVAALKSIFPPPPPPPPQG